MTAERRRYLRKLLLVGAALPLAISVAGAAVAVSWLDRLPAQVAIHWGRNGLEPDGFGPAWLIPAMLLLITAAFSAAAVVALSGASGTVNRTGRFLLATGTWLSTTLTVGLVGSLVPQLDLAHARSAPDPVLPLVAGAALGLVLGAAAWFLAPEPPEDGVGAPPVERVHLGGGARAVWTATSSTSPALAIVLALVAVALLVQAIVLTFALGASAWPIFIAPLAIGLALSTLTWQLRIDHRGVVARSLLGFPRIWIPADRIEDADVVTVSPVADFGGWGLRWLPGRVGVILRGGEALQVRERNGRTVTISTHDAARAAGVAHAVAAQVAAQPQR